MSRKLWRSAVALAAACLAVPAFTTTAQAAPAAPATLHVAADTAAEANAVAAKWTPEAMRKAIPLDRLLPSVDAAKLTQDVAKGASQVVAPSDGVSTMAF